MSHQPLLLLLLALWLPAWPTAGRAQAPICTATERGATACVGGKLCRCGFVQGGGISGAPTGDAWDCGVLRPSCPPDPDAPVDGGAYQGPIAGEFYGRDDRGADPRLADGPPGDWRGYDDAGARYRQDGREDDRWRYDQQGYGWGDHDPESLRYQESYRDGWRHHGGRDRWDGGDGGGWRGRRDRRDGLDASGRDYWLRDRFGPLPGERPHYGGYPVRPFPWAHGPPPAGGTPPGPSPMPGGAPSRPPPAYWPPW